MGATRGVVALGVTGFSLSSLLTMTEYDARCVSHKIVGRHNR